MKTICLSLLTFAAFVLHAGRPLSSSGLCFTENKGQVADQHGNRRNDVLFGGTDGRLSFHLLTNGISYQLCRVDSWLEARDAKTGAAYSLADKATICRVDVKWLNSSKAEIIAGEALEGYANFYSDVCPDGALQVYSYKSVMYRALYHGIDLKWYIKDGKLKYDYLVAAGADPSQIQLRFEGAKQMFINAGGELVIKTALGDIIEQAPLVMQAGKSLKSKWKLRRNIASFEIENLNRSHPFIIDPGVRQWGTYYGGSSIDVGSHCITDPSGNLYMTGYSMSPGGTVIATVGSHQTTYSGSGLENAILVKFNPSGNRIWSTYYGGNVREVALACSADDAGNVIMAGNSQSNNGTVIATANGHQPTAGGGWDAFLVKFNSAGVRQWGTYYGASTPDYGTACAAATDGSGDIYLCGRTVHPSGTLIATPGSHQSTYGGNTDGFLVKFNSAGQRQWGTYFGGDGTEEVNYCITDPAGNIYMTGQTSSTDIATPGAYQTTWAGSWDAFVVKFNNSGILQWCSFYGGQQDDRGMALARDPANGNIFLAGRTTSSDGNSIATDGSQQSSFGGGNFDAFLVKLNPQASVRHWGTYYGGSGDDQGWGCAVNTIGYVYLTGMTSTSVSSVIATPGSHQATFGGGTFDAYLAQFNENGSRVWGSYYGDAGYDISNACTLDNNYAVYITGYSDATTGTMIATPASHQSSYGGGGCDAYFVKFYDCNVPPSPNNITSPASPSICSGGSVSFTVSGPGNMSWYNVPSGGAAIGSGSVYTTPVLSTGNHIFYAEAFTCTNSVRTPVSVTVHALPNVSANSTSSMLCAGQSATLSATGASSYSWSNGSNSAVVVVSPSVSTSYTLTGTDVNGCVNSTVITQAVTICTALKESAETAAGLQMYPNPAKDAVYISGLTKNATISIYNSLGEKLFDHKAAGANALLNISSLAEGIYFLRFDQNGSLHTCKLIVVD